VTDRLSSYAELAEILEILPVLLREGRRSRRLTLRAATHTTECESLASAVGFACDGEEDWRWAVQRIDGPCGAVLEGEVLQRAKMRFMMPERYGELADMPLPGAST
jgi:hypothetical protein